MHSNPPHLKRRAGGNYGGGLWTYDFCMGVCNVGGFKPTIALNSCAFVLPPRTEADPLEYLRLESSLWANHHCLRLTRQQLLVILDGGLTVCCSGHDVKRNYMLYKATHELPHDVSHCPLLFA